VAQLPLSAHRIVPVAAALTVVLLTPLTTHAETSDRHPTSLEPVVIRVYEVGTKNPELSAALESSVTRLLESVDANVDVLFVDCARENACTQPSPGTLVLRLAPGRHPNSARQCGEATAGPGGRRGVLMTVFRGCVVDTRRELRDGALTQQGAAFALLSLTESDIIGAVVVHELIHLVLPEELHGKGLFKATLDARDWMDVASGLPHLDTALISRLSRALTVQPVTLAAARASAGGSR
jgi:hypothetical protein